MVDRDNDYNDPYNSCHPINEPETPIFDFFRWLGYSAVGGGIVGAIVRPVVTQDSSNESLLEGMLIGAGVGAGLCLAVGLARGANYLIERYKCRS